MGLRRGYAFGGGGILLVDIRPKDAMGLTVKYDVDTIDRSLASTQAYQSVCKLTAESLANTRIPTVQKGALFISCANRIHPWAAECSSKALIFSIELLSSLKRIEPQIHLHKDRVRVTINWR